MVNYKRMNADRKFLSAPSFQIENEWKKFLKKKKIQGQIKRSWSCDVDKESKYFGRVTSICLENMCVSKERDEFFIILWFFSEKNLQ